MPKHFHQKIKKYEIIEDIIEALKITNSNDQKQLNSGLAKMSKNNLGNLYHWIIHKQVANIK